MRTRSSASGGTGARMLGCALLAAVLGATGCADAPVPATAVPVRFEIVQLRGDVAGGFIELRVTNEGAGELVIDRATYVSSAWSTPIERVDEARIPAGARRNLRMRLPEPTCDGGEVEHRATLELADGTVVQGEPGDPHGQLEALDDGICDLRSFERDVAGLTWLAADIPSDGSRAAVLRLAADIPSDGSRAAVLRLEVSPVPGDGERLGAVDEIPATVLLTPTDATGGRLEALPVALEVVGGDTPTVVDVPLAPGRCDLHAVAEDKQGTIFRIRATSGDAPVDLLLPVPDAQRNALLGWVVTRCGG